jgi:hypothetical protein
MIDKIMNRFHPPSILAINFPYYREVPHGRSAMVPTTDRNAEPHQWLSLTFLPRLKEV